jgi:phage repressor protein C with HTH and peptisase S24 domain
MSKNDNDLNKDEMTLLLELLGIAEADLAGVTGVKLGIKWLFAHNQDEVSAKAAKRPKPTNQTLKQLISQTPTLNNEMARKLSVYVPRFEWEMVAYLDQYIGKFNYLNFANWVSFQPKDVRISSNTFFALEVVNNEMEPYFKVGDNIIIDTERKAANGDSVITKDENGTFILRKLVIKGMDRLLVANRPGCKTIKIDGTDDNIYGVVIASVRN